MKLTCVIYISLTYISCFLAVSPSLTVTLYTTIYITFDQIFTTCIHDSYVLCTQLLDITFDQIFTTYILTLHQTRQHSSIRQQTKQPPAFYSLPNYTVDKPAIIKKFMLLIIIRRRREPTKQACSCTYMHVATQAWRHAFS